MTLALASEAFDGTWRINVSGRVYGPYSGHQIKAFAAEGRLAPHSVVQADEQGPWITAIDDPVLGQLFVKSTFETPLHAVTTNADTASGNVVVIADLRTGTATFEPAIRNLGDTYRLNAQTWFLHTNRTAASVRDALAPHLGSLDRLFVVDASRGGKTAWFNLGPEADAKIRKVWRRSAA